MSVLHVMADGFPANHLTLDYHVRLTPVVSKPLSTGPPVSPRVAIREQQGQAQLRRAVEEIFAALQRSPDGEQVIFFAQDRLFLRTVKDLLVKCNMRLVVSIAKKHSVQTDNFFELLSDGNMSLLRAVEKFDYSRGNKFSTYASWAIMKNFARSIPEEKRRRERYLTSNDEFFDAAADTRSDEHEAVASAEQASHRIEL